MLLRHQCAWRSIPASPGSIDRLDAFLDFLIAERAFFIVPAIAGAIRRKHVKLHQVNVLADDIGWRAYLEVILLILVRNQVRHLEGDTVARVGANKQGLRRTGPG